MQQLGELQKSAGALTQQADVYVINGDTPEDSRRLKQVTGLAIPVLLDPQLTAARAYDMVPRPGEPMGMMSGVAQMGFVIADASGTIRVQRVDVHFGEHAGQILEILRILRTQPASGTPTR